jgi:phage baseplate assembly protein W
MAIALRADKETSKELKSIIYQDIFTNTLINNDTKDVSLITNEDAVKMSIINIMLTNPGEKFFDTSFGSEINKILFENITPQTTAVLNTLITTAIENYEPRARLIDVISSPLPDNNAYAITIVFSVINKTEPISLEFVLNRVR